MTKSEMFKKAHQIAKTFTGDYRARFVMALALVRNTPVEIKKPVEISRIKMWENYGKKRVYFTVESKDFYYDVLNAEFAASKKGNLNLVTDEIMDYFIAKFVA